MPQDATVQVAFIGILTTFITTGGVVIVAFINNRRERTGAAESGVEAALRERLALRDEQLMDLREEKSELLERLNSCLVENDEKTMLVRHLRDELERARQEKK